MFADGSFAVALVKSQVMVVRGKILFLSKQSVANHICILPAVRCHTKRDKYLDVQTYFQFGNNVFLASDVPSARITSSSILTFLPPLEDSRLLSQGMLELPKKAFSQYIELNCHHQKRYERLWSAWIDKH